MTTQHALQHAHPPFVTSPPPEPSTTCDVAGCDDLVFDEWNLAYPWPHPPEFAPIPTWRLCDKHHADAVRWHTKARTES